MDAGSEWADHMALTHPRGKKLKEKREYTKNQLQKLNLFLKLN
jgi:hypothetical protein